MQTLFPLAPVGYYCLAFIIASAAYVGCAVVVRRRTLAPTTVMALLAVGIIVRAALIPVTPIGSDDIYRYLWDGRVQTAGVDPYAHAPGDSALASLHTATLPARVNHPTLVSPYLPMSEWLFWVAWQIGGEDPAGFKVLLFIAECCTLFLLDRMLRQLALPRQSVLLYALCPLPIMVFALDGHVDALGMPLLLLALLFWQRERNIPALVMLGLSLAIKPVGAVLLPWAFGASRSWRGRLMVVAIPAIIVAVQFLPYLRSSDPLAGMLVFGRNWTFNGAIFEWILAGVQDNQVARAVCGVLLGAALVLVARRRLRLEVSAYLSVMLLLLFSPVVHPWYVAWLAIFVVLTFAWSGIAYLALVSLASLTTVAYVTTGVWGISPWILIIEYAPVFVIFLIELGRIFRYPQAVR